MPDPQRLLRTLRQARQAFRDTPGRRGKVVVLSDAAEVLVAGDLHGNVENFRGLLQQAELGKNPHRHLVLQELIHGAFRYPTGGDKSHQLLDLLAALKCQYRGQVHMLLGNHELAQWRNQLVAKGDDDFNALFREGVQTAYGAHAESIYAAYLELFASLSLAVRTPNRVFLSHSCPTAVRLEIFDPTALERDESTEHDVGYGGSVHSLVWGRDTRPESVAAFLRIVDADWLITGHIPCEKGYEVPNERQIILDCMKSPGCYCLFPTDRPVTQAELIRCIGTL